MQLLLDAQADLSATDADGDEALDNAWKAGRQDVVEAIRREEQRRSALREKEKAATAAEAVRLSEAHGHGSSSPPAAAASEAATGGSGNQDGGVGDNESAADDASASGGLRTRRRMLAGVRRLRWRIHRTRRQRRGWTNTLMTTTLMIRSMAPRAGDRNVPAHTGIL